MIWCHMYNLKNVENTHGVVLLLVKLQASACNFNKSNTPPWLFFTFFKLYKWYHIAQRVTSTMFLNASMYAQYRSSVRRIETPEAGI